MADRGVKVARMAGSVAIAAACLLAAAALAQPQAPGAGPASAAAVASLRDVEPIDTHVHAFKPDAALNALFKRLHLHVLNVLLIDDRDPYMKAMEPQWSDALAVRRATSGRASVCTTIDPYGFESAGFVRAVNGRLDHDFEAGAVAVKLYKVIGMQIRTRAGAYVMPDDPAFGPVLEHIASRGKTVLAHFAEPDSCWQPLDPASPDYDYYKQHPEEHAYRHPEWPSKTAILAARDRMLAAHPKLRVVGAHLGSMEVDVDQIAARFDRYPNFAVDTAARIVYLMRQPPEKVRAFLVKYQDRVLYGTDLVMMPDATSSEAVRAWERMYERRKLFHDNAVRWMPGIAP